MAIFTYDARRSIALGHVVDESYVIELRLAQCNEDEVILAEDQFSLNGTSESLYFGCKRTWQCVTRPIEYGLLPYVLEFLDSTKDRQEFTADFHGSLARPDSPITVYRTDTSSPRNRVARLGNGGRDDYRSFSFTLREV